MRKQVQRRRNQHFYRICNQLELSHNRNHSTQGQEVSRQVSRRRNNRSEVRTPLRSRQQRRMMVERMNQSRKTIIITESVVFSERKEF